MNIFTSLINKVKKLINNVGIRKKTEQEKNGVKINDTLNRINSERTFKNRRKKLLNNLDSRHVIRSRGHIPIDANNPTYKRNQYKYNSGRNSRTH